jgi:16S rRNA (cytosine967-C5)-methyltransferase
VLTGSPDEVPALREGRARVQDEGSQLVALALAEAPVIGADQGRWLDLCAGPGGKAALLGATLAGRRASGEVASSALLTAVEISAHRAELVRGSLAGVEHAAPGLVEVREMDGRTIGEEQPDTFDRILVDAPCTGLGALRRRPEARWRRQPGDVAALGPIQRSLLAAALDAVRPGGVVVYATCSPHPAETISVVDDQIRKRPEIEKLDARGLVAAITGQRIDELGPGPYVQLWPHVHGTDAMFMTVLRKGSDVG